MGWNRSGAFWCVTRVSSARRFQTVSEVFCPQRNFTRESRRPWCEDNIICSGSTWVNMNQHEIMEWSKSESSWYILIYYGYILIYYDDVFWVSFHFFSPRWPLTANTSCSKAHGGCRGRDGLPEASGLEGELVPLLRCWDDQVTKGCHEGMAGLTFQDFSGQDTPWYT